MQAYDFFVLRFIFFGTHLSKFHGNTIDTIIKDGFTIDHKVEHIPSSDTAEAIANSMAEASRQFVSIWKKEKDNYDLVLCLGDRFEMFAAVSIATPFQISFAHLHGGETSLGAMDNEFRHCITLFSSLHFVATEAYAERVAAIKKSNENIYVVGALSLDNLKLMKLLSKEEFKEKFSIDLSIPTLLITYHPETVWEKENKEFAEQLVKALDHFSKYQVIITMPNADMMGNTMRKVYEEFAKGKSNVILVENFGTQGYFTCMKKADLVIGNSSSGIIEAASLGKYVVNIGDRQKGRAMSANVIQSKADADSIIDACEGAIKKGPYTGENIYLKGNAAKAIISVLKQWKQ
jgi:GDP/UDP-N,N'-diacetylbacillosamine 2-epimerase (hydrolysing)